MKSFYLTSARFIVEICFHPTENPEYRNLFMDNIALHFSKQKIRKPSRKPDGRIDIFFETNIDTIKNDQNKRTYTYFYKSTSPTHLSTHYGISLFHFQLVLRDLLQSLLESNGGFFIHASTALINEKAYIFMGASGAGKSTIISLIDNCKKLADDVGIVRPNGKGAYLFYQTLFKEKFNDSTILTSGAKIGGVFFLKKSRKTYILPIKNSLLILSLLKSQLWPNKIGATALKNLKNYVVDKKYFSYLYFEKKRGAISKVIDEYSTTIAA